MAEADFQSYSDLRWRDLVFSLEQAGVTGVTARMVVADVLVAHRRRWSGLVRRDDIDRYLWAAVRDRAGLPPDPGAAPRMAPELEFRHFSRATAEQPDRAEPWLSRATHRRRLRRRVRWVRLVQVTAATAVLTMVVGSATHWWLNRPEPPTLRAANNPLPVPWYADDELHLDGVVVGLPGLTAFESVGSGVAVRWAGGETALVTADGELNDLSPSHEFPTDGSPMPRLSAADFAVLDRIETDDGTVVRVVLYRKGWDSLVRDRYVAIVCSESGCREHTLEVSGRVRFS